MKLSRQLMTFALAFAMGGSVFAQNSSQSQTTPPTTTEANKAQTGTANQQQNPTTDPTDTTTRDRQATGGNQGTPTQSGTGSTAGQSTQSTGSTAGQSTQSTGSTTDQSTGTTGANRSTTGDRNRTASTTAGAGDMLSPTDRRFLMEAAEGGMAEVHMAQSAQTKASNDAVKEVARTIEQDHTQANNELKRIAGIRGVDLPSAPPTTGKHQQATAKLERASGADFDRAFLQEAIKHHRNDIKEFERYSKNGMDSELKQFAENQLPTLRKHLQAAESAMASVKSGGSSRKTSSTDTSSKTTSDSADTSKK